MNAFEYSKYTIELCSKYDFIQSIEILLLDEPVVKIKATVNEKTFISIFYNASTQKYSFAVIRNKKEFSEWIILKTGIFIHLKIPILIKIRNL
jgi:hypothetical protein